MLTTLILAAALDMPPMPPGLTPKTVALSPKATELKASWGTPMAKVAVSGPLAVPTGFTITNITVQNGMVSLSWQMGQAPFQVQVSNGKGWSNIGSQTSDRSASFPVGGPYAFYRILSVGGPVSGTAMLQRQFGGLTTSAGSGITLKNCVVDNAGNLIVVGQMVYSNDCGSGTVVSAGGQDAVIAKFDSTGTCLWTKRFGNVSNDSANGVAVDSADNVLVIGSVSGGIDPGTLDFGFGTDATFGGSDVMVVKYSPAGAVIWHKVFGGSGGDVGIGVAVDSSDNILLTGTHGFFGSGANFGGGILPTYGQQDVFLAKLTPAGSHIWSKSFGGSDSDSVSGVAVDSVGDVVITGSFRGTATFGTGSLVAAGGKDAYIAKYFGGTGAAAWVKQLGDSNDQIGNGVAVDGLGNVFAALDYYGVITFPGKVETAMQGGSFIVVKYDSGGTYKWSRSFGADINGPHIAGIAVNASGRAVAVGEMITGIDFGDGSGWLLGQGGNDIFTLRFDNDDTGTVLWARRGAPYADRGLGVALNRNLGLIYAIGDCGAETDFYHLNLSAQTTAKTSGTRNNTFWVTYSP